MFPITNTGNLSTPASNGALGQYSLASSQPSQQQTTDPNSIELFKQNIALVQEQLARVEQIAKSALLGVQNAYNEGNSPAQTHTELVTLNQTINNLYDLLNQSGVGALLALPPNAPAPTQDKLLTDASRCLHVDFERVKHSQEAASDVLNLLKQQ